MAKGPKKKHAHDSAKKSGASPGKTVSSEKLNNKEYKREFFKLQTELVKMQEWVKATPKITEVP